MIEQVNHLDSHTTVVIPFYNGKDYIRSAVESIYAQTVLPKEIIIVDDCSTDDSYSLLHQLKAESQIPMQIHKLDQNSGGPVMPMSIGIRKATTEFVTLLDQDDIMLPNRIKDQLEAIASTPTAFACIGYLIRIDQNDNKLNDGFLESTRIYFSEMGGTRTNSGVILNPANARQHAFSKGSLNIASSTTIRKSTWMKIGGFGEDYRIAWDFDFSLRGLNEYDLVCVNDVIGYYRVHPGNTSGNTYLCTKEIFKCRRSLMVDVGRGLDPISVRKKIAMDSYGMSFLESDRGFHAEAIRLALLSLRLQLCFRSFVALVKATTKFGVSCFGSSAKFVRKKV